MSIKGYVFGGKETAERIVALGPKVAARMLIFMKKMVFKLQAKVKRDKLSGQVLKVRSGTLRRSIYAKVEQKSTGSAVGIVGTILRYAGIHEYGFLGSESVKAHLREIKQAFGQPLRQPREVRVRAHIRKMNMPERSFLRSAMEEMKAEFREGMQAEIAAVLRGAKR